MRVDKTLENLLDLHGMKMVIDEKLGLWVKFEAFTTDLSTRENGLRYSLTLHNKEGHRIMGFDNAHEIEYGGKRMEDFWMEVEKRLILLKEKLK